MATAKLPRDIDHHHRVHRLSLVVVRRANARKTIGTKLEHDTETETSNIRRWVPFLCLRLCVVSLLRWYFPSFLSGAIFQAIECYRID